MLEEGLNFSTKSREFSRNVNVDRFFSFWACAKHENVVDPEFVFGRLHYSMFEI